MLHSTVGRHDQMLSRTAHNRWRRPLGVHAFRLPQAVRSRHTPSPGLVGGRPADRVDGQDREANLGVPACVTASSWPAACPPPPRLELSSSIGHLNRHGRGRAEAGPLRAGLAEREPACNHTICELQIRDTICRIRKAEVVASSVSRATCVCTRNDGEVRRAGASRPRSPLP